MTEPEIPNPSRHVDDLVELVDHALQRTPEFAYPDGTLDPSVCWRCQSAAPAPDSTAGVCARCREILLDETYTRPSIDEWMRERFTMIDEILARGLAASFSRTLAQAMRDFDQAMRSFSETTGITTDRLAELLAAMRAPVRPPPRPWKANVHRYPQRRR